MTESSATPAGRTQGSVPPRPAGPTCTPIGLLIGVGLLAILAPLVTNDCPYTVRGTFAGPARRAIREIRVSSRTLQALAADTRDDPATAAGRRHAMEAELRFLRARSRELAENIRSDRRTALEEFASRLAMAGDGDQRLPSPAAAAALAAAAARLEASYPIDTAGPPAGWLAQRRVWPLLARTSDTELVLFVAGLLLGLLALTRSIRRLRRVAIERSNGSGAWLQRTARRLLLLAVVIAALAALVRATVGHDPTRWSYKEAIDRGEIATVSAVFPPIPYGPREVDNQALRHPPLWKPLDGPRHLLGTDESGRDLLTLIVWGSRTSLLVALISTAVLTSLGVMVGGLAGYSGGWIDATLSRLIEIVQSIPAFVAIMGVLAFADRGIASMALIMALLLWPGVARLVRVEFIRLRSLDFATASRALGCHPLRVMWAHMLPNALGPVLVAATFAAAGAIFVESGLSFLGLGPADDAPSWGALLAAARHAPGDWWMSLFPGLLIFGAVASFNWIGESLRRAADPRETRLPVSHPSRLS